MQSGDRRKTLMLQIFAPSLAILCAVFAVLGCAYALFATALTRRLGRESVVAALSYPGVTIMKPLHGAEPSLYQNLASFCDQDYPGPVQWLFGVQDRDDPAVAVVERLAKGRSRSDLQWFVTSGSRGPN